MRVNLPLARKPGFPRLGALLACGLVLLLAVSCDSVAGDGAGAEIQASEAERESEAIAVRVAPVREEPIASLYTTSANLRADARAMVTARTRGVVEKLMVEEGDLVTAGQPLAVLEDDEQRIVVERTAAIRDIRKNEYERSLALKDKGVLSDNDFEVVHREAEEAKHAAALAQLELDRTVIRAPFSGMIVTRYLDMGGTVNDGTNVYELADLDPLYADVSVPERSVAQLMPGQRVRLFSDSTGRGSNDRGSNDHAVEALIERIAPAVDPGTGTVKVTLTVAEQEGLRPGSFVRVHVVTDTHPQALVISRQALVAEGRRWHLFRVLPEGDVVEMLEVELGFEEDDRVEILQVLGDKAPLVVGDPVVVTGAAALSEGSRVEVMETVEELTEIPAGPSD